MQNAQYFRLLTDLATAWVLGARRAPALPNHDQARMEHALAMLECKDYAISVSDLAPAHDPAAEKLAANKARIAEIERTLRDKGVASGMAKVAAGKAAERKAFNAACSVKPALPPRRRGFGEVE